jgi:hypothetical protein
MRKYIDIINESNIIEATGIATIKNPNAKQWTSLISDNMVRCLVMADGSGAIVAWNPAHGLHSDVMAQLGTTMCFPLRVFGVPGSSARIEITETIRKTEFADEDPEEVVMAIESIPFFKTMFSHVDVEDFLTTSDQR